MFPRTVENTVTANGIFKGWEASWIRRCLIINAIRTVFYGGATAGQTDSWCEVDGESIRCSAVDALAGLAPPLDRFVLVMSVLEKYSEHECALLLSRTPRDIGEARFRALWQLSGVSSGLTKIAG